MENSFKIKNRNALVIIFEILIIALGVGGITYATSKIINDKTTTILTAGEYNIDYVGDNLVTVKDLYPMEDSNININTKDNVIRLEFKLKGVSSNKRDDLIYDVMLSEMNIDCSLLNKYTKWNLYKNGSLLTSGNLDPSFDGNVLTDTLRLTTIQEDLPKPNNPYDEYVLLFWISESCDDILTCERIDQSNIANSNLSMKVFIALYGGAKKQFERIPNYDTSCANKPELYNNMVPVTYQNGTWVVANEDNSTKENMWYDYGTSKWANAVVVKNNKYQKIGTPINETDVLAYYVWIPRYRYKLWNAEETITDSYKAYDEGIDIIFENGLNSTPNNSLKNDNYLTHPAFANNLTGFWINKYELSKKNNQYLSIPNETSYNNDTLENYQTIINNLSADYKLGNKATTHIVNNLEWGATLYLSHSKYGVCLNDGCTHIDTNQTLISGNNKQDTTTRNVYGVYDMAGASPEYTTGSEKIGTATNEVILDNGDTWYSGHSIASIRDYLVRGGQNNSLFYYGDIGMGSNNISTRSVLISKTNQDK